MVRGKVDWATPSSFQEKAEELVQLVKPKLQPVSSRCRFPLRVIPGRTLHGAHFQEDEIAGDTGGVRGRSAEYHDKLIDLFDDLETSARVTPGNGFNRV
jgi:hypothetical protein